jgi:hypothetical protein
VGCGKRRRGGDKSSQGQQPGAVQDLCHGLQGVEYGFLVVDDIVRAAVRGLVPAFVQRGLQSCTRSWLLRSRHSGNAYCFGWRLAVVPGWAVILWFGA